MSENNLYYIYIDTKIPGALEQLVSYFQARIFDRNACISVVCKYYKEIDSLFSSVFSEYDIPYHFIKKRSDLSLIKGKTVFYLFNAQSNCRMVAHRDLTHIFVTHGESHKLASIKPIIKIYDYVVTSGRVGIDRYLKSGIFSLDDIKREKVISLGDTFIGDNRFFYASNAVSLVYAPTWEGGVPEENYSSISQSTAQKIISFCHEKGITTVYIQPHPNLGHRDASYKNEFKKMVSLFRGNAINVIVIKRDSLKKINIFTKFLAKKDTNSKINVRYALTDISAMEMQFFKKEIPYAVFIQREVVSSLSIPSRMESYYSKVFISEDKPILINDGNGFLDKELHEYLLSYHRDELRLKNYKERIQWLCNYTNAHRESNLSELKSLY